MSKIRTPFTVGRLHRSFKTNTRARISMGILTLFIAAIMGATITVDVLYESAYDLRDQGLITSERVLEDISSGLRVIGITGVREKMDTSDAMVKTDANSEIEAEAEAAGDGEDDMVYGTENRTRAMYDGLTSLRMKLSLLPGSPPVPLSRMTVWITNGRQESYVLTGNEIIFKNTPSSDETEISYQNDDNSTGSTETDAESENDGTRQEHTTVLLHGQGWSISPVRDDDHSVSRQGVVTDGDLITLTMDLFREPDFLEALPGGYLRVRINLDPGQDINEFVRVPDALLSGITVIQ